MKPRSLGHRSTRVLSGALAAACAIACSKDAQVTTRTVTVNVPAACAVDSKGYASYFALGDFEPPTTPPGPYLASTGTTLAQVTPAARALVVTVGEGSGDWEGVAPVATSGDVNVMVLPDDRSCALTGSFGTRDGTVLGPAGPSRMLLTGGITSNTPAFDFVVHTDTGVVAQVSHGLHTPRTLPTVTAWSGGAVVAGGVGLDGSAPIGSAEVFDASAEGFTGTIDLAEPRAGHAAVTLVDGRTLLVGGYTDAATTAPIASMEIVDPAGKSTTQEGVARLSPVLASPVAVRLASGEVLVAGLGAQGSNGAVGLEWFSPDASRATASMTNVPFGAPFALTALPGGGAIIVLPPPASAPAGFANTWVVSADHAVTAATPVPGNLDAPYLLDGVDGAPLLWTGDRWLAWQPWSGAFGAAPVLDVPLHTLSVGVATAETGLAMWFDPQVGQLFALRTGVASAFAADPAPLAVLDATGLAPDRLPGPGGVSFNGGSGVTMSHGASAFVTDRTYADVSMQVTCAPGAAADVVLRDETGVEAVVDGACCVLPPTAESSGAVLSVTRRGSAVTCAVGAAAPKTCAAAPSATARVTLGVRGPSDVVPTIVSKIVVQRLGEP